MLLLYCTVTQSSLGLVGLKSHPKAVGDATIGFLTTVLILVSRGASGEGVPCKSVLLWLDLPEMDLPSMLCNGTT